MSVHAAQFQQAVMLFETGLLAEAKTKCTQILKAERRNIDCIRLLSVIAAQEGDLETAVGLLRKALKIEPQLLEAHYNLGTALSGLGQHASAVESYDRVLSHQTDHIDAMLNRAASLNQMGQYSDAITGYDQVIARVPDLAEAWDNRGISLMSLHRYADALESHTRAVTLRPSSAEVHYHRGRALVELRRFEEALESYNQALRIRPDFPEAHSDRGGVLVELKRFDAALQIFESIIAADPQNAGAHLNKGLILLHMERMKEGWEFYEWRKRTPDAAAYPRFPRPLWTGHEPIEGKTLLVHSEQGLGDTIQFCRYAKLASARGAKVILAVQDLLVDLIRTIDTTIDVVSINTRRDDFDYFIPTASMPMAFETMTETIPADIPYLRAEDSKIEKWRSALGEQGFKIAICWQGSPGRLDKGRSFPLSMFQNISRIPDVRLISVQKNAGVEQLSQMPAGMKVETLNEDFSFSDTAAVMQVADLVITTDTASAHLAGALGRPTWVVLKHVPDWRWLSAGNSTPWYPTMRLFRQPANGDWASAFSEVERELLALPPSRQNQSL